MKESDHNVLQTEFDCKVKCITEKEKNEIYNLKNKDSQAKFKEYTSKGNALSSIFDSADNLDKLVERFIKKLDGCISQNFSKIRLKEKRNDKNQVLYDKMRELKGKNDPESKTKLEKIKAAIADAAHEKFRIIKDEVDSLKQNESLNSNKLWKLKKKLCPNSRDPPSAMLDSNGNLITSDQIIKERALENYTERLTSNKINDNLKEHEEETNKLCETRMKLVKLNKTEPWDIDDLKIALKKLGKDKSRDAQGYANEIFKEEVAGSDLLKAVLKLMNMIKERQIYPKIMEKCNITSLHKKGPKNDFSNYRGVFRLPILRCILDTLIYNSSYETIDRNLSDGNVGCRKERGCRDNIFVISAISNSVVNGTSPPIQVQITDVEKCFDKMWLQSCINSLYDAGLQNDMLNLLYIENKNANIAVKVNNILSKRKSVKNVEIQGSVWAGLKCTSMMDTLNQKVMAEKGLQYHYKEDKNIPIGVRGMVDDTLGISNCGNEAIALNSAINSFIQTQRLTLSEKKSVVIHIGKKHQTTIPCPTLKIHKSNMKEAKSAKYLGNLITSRGGVSETVEDRRSKGWGKVATIQGILSEVDLGSHRVEVGLILGKAILVNSLLFTAETWSGVKEADLVRLEQVDQALLRSLVAGHSKCASEFAYLETGSLKL